MNSFQSDQRKQRATSQSLNQPSTFVPAPPVAEHDAPAQQGRDSVGAGYSLADLSIHAPAPQPPAMQLQKSERTASQEQPEPASQGQQANQTGLPDGLKDGVERLSGYSLDNIRVHYNSPKPAEVQALAYTQGTEIHVGPGQEQHLAHEAWHVVQQMQGRVQPTMQMKGVAINDDQGLEREADVMGGKASQVMEPQLLAVRQTVRVPVSQEDDGSTHSNQPVIGLAIDGLPQDQIIQRVQLDSTYTEEDSKKSPRPFWSLPAGYRFEQNQGATIGGNEPVIDSVEGTTAVSLKTFDLLNNYAFVEDGKRYMDLAGFRTTLKAYLRALMNWPAAYTLKAVDFSTITKKVLRIAIPKLKSTWPEMYDEVYGIINTLTTEYKANNDVYVNKKETVPMDVEIVEDTSLFSERHRGYKFEERNNASVEGADPGNTPVIDNWDSKTGIATSLKTFDLARNYQDAQKGFSRFKSTWEKYVQKAKKFGEKGDTLMSGTDVLPKQIRMVILRVAIPPEKLIRTHNPNNADRILQYIKGEKSAYPKLPNKDSGTFDFQIRVEEIGSSTEFGGLLTD